MPHVPPISIAVYQKLEEFYRKDPGDWIGAAKAVNVDRRTSRRAWMGPIWKQGDLAGIPCIRERFGLEDQQRRAQQASVEQATRQRHIEELEKAQKLEEEAKAIDQAVLRLARNDVLGGLRSLGQMREGIEKLCIRVGKELERGTDAAGNPIPVDPIRTMKIVASFAHASKQLVEAANVLHGIDRLDKKLPTAILGLEVSNITLEDAEREIELAGVALRKAKEMGLVVLDGGKKTG